MLDIDWNGGKRLYARDTNEVLEVRVDELGMDGECRFVERGFVP